MTDEMEKIIDSYYEDSIELPENRLLCFKRISNYKCTDRRAVKVSIEDLETETKIDLGLYFDAKWKFSSPMNERTFWLHVKDSIDRFKEIFDRMREAVPIKEVHVYKIRFRQISDRVSSKMDKLTTIFKSELNESNV
ncbi:MAG: hypothetical protein EBS34_13475 [Flavobacteriales bacterium]|nr:hypothetical protein [Flavobacteriales bacterium]